MDLGQDRITVQTTFPVVYYTRHWCLLQDYVSCCILYQTLVLAARLTKRLYHMSLQKGGILIQTEMPDKNANHGKKKRLLRKPRQSQRPLPSSLVSDGPNDELFPNDDEDDDFHFVDSPLDYDFIQNDDEQQPALELFPETPKYEKSKINKCRKTKSELEKGFILETPARTASLVKPKLARGPSNFPCRPMHRMANLLYDILWDEDDLNYYSVPAFTLNDFMYHVAAYGKVPVRTVTEAMFSKHNYKKLTKIMAEENARTLDNTLKTLDFSEQLTAIPAAATRVPNRHLLYEMAALVKEQINEALSTEVQAVIKPLPKYTSPYFPGEGPLTEIVIYESSDGVSPAKSVVFNENQMAQSHSVADSLLQSATPRYFQGAGRSQSPFVNPEATDLSLAEMSLLDCLAKGGLALSLKAQFLSTLPDISPVSRTLTYLNLSFNDYKMFPLEVLSCRQLTVLKMRNNPLVEIPPDIKVLSRLKTLVLSFCMLTNVTPNVFSMRSLNHLDVSYNKLTFLPSEIKNARQLAELNLEGNSFYAMPCGALKLHRLKSLRVKNNFMHPLFWREATKNEPQSLVDICALAIHESNMVKNLNLQLEEKCQEILDDYSQCDCCGKPCYGPGIRIIRPCTMIFGVKNLPFLFRSCGPTCASKFMNNSEGIADIIYG